MEQAATIKEFKVFNDPIHGSIEIPQLCVKIIDTPEFQRLRSIKQLGGVSYVYPGAVHTRFEHSIGVCYLAGLLVKSLREHQPELGISNKDVMCVEIAGLCHDLGHGPFSYMFEEKVIPRMFEGEASEVKKLTHEDYSQKLFAYLLTKNNLIPEFETKGLTVKHREYITDLLIGKKPNEDEDSELEGKSFLFEIVSNKTTGIDVDKWDYFARDGHMLGFKNNFDHRRCIQMARVLKIDGRLQMCFRDKEANFLFDMFYTRLTLYRRAYKHKVVQIVEYMLTDAIVKVAESNSITFTGKDDQQLTLKQVIENRDEVAYCQLTDHIIDQIRHSVSTDTAVKKAQRILRDIDTRKVFTLAGENRFKPGNIIAKKNLKDKADEIEGAILNLVEHSTKGTKLSKGTIMIDFVGFDYGMKENKNPIDNVWFYDKTLMHKRLPKEKVSHLLPDIYHEQLIRVFCKDSRYTKDVGAAFNQWCSGSGREEVGYQPEYDAI